MVTGTSMPAGQCPPLLPALPSLFSTHWGVCCLFTHSPKADIYLLMLNRIMMSLESAALRSEAAGGGMKELNM